MGRKTLDRPSFTSTPSFIFGGSHRGPSVGCQLVPGLGATLGGSGLDKWPTLSQNGLLPYMECRGQPPITPYIFHPVVYQAYCSSVETPELRVQCLHPPAVLGMRLLYREIDPKSDLIRNLLKERVQVRFLQLGAREEKCILIWVQNL